MDRARIIDALTREANALAARGVASLFLFGSAARDDVGPESDVDLFVDLRPDARFSLFDLMDLREHLTRVLGARADVFTRDSLHRVIRARIEREAIRVF